MIILIIHIIFYYYQNILLIFLCERWILCQAFTSVLCLHYRPETVHCSTKDVYTSEITFLALHPWSRQTKVKIGILHVFNYFSCYWWISDMLSNKFASLIVVRRTKTRAATRSQSWTSNGTRHSPVQCPLMKHCNFRFSQNVLIF